MEFEEPANFSNSSDDAGYPPVQEEYISHEIVFALFALVAIIADSLIVFTIFRFRQLYTVANIYLANWAIADIASMFVTPSAYHIISVLEYLPLPIELYCILSHSGVILHEATLIFVILVALDWLISAYLRRASSKFRKFYKYIIGVIWTIIVIFLLITTGLCISLNFHDKYYFRFLGLLFLAVFSIVVIIQAVRLIQKLRKRPSDVSSLPINLVTAFVSSWVLAILNLIFSARYIDHPLIITISSCLMFSSSVINFGLLYNFDRDFHACVLQVFRCSRNKNLNDTNQRQASIANIVENDTINITFNKPTSYLVES